MEIYINSNDEIKSDKESSFDLSKKSFSNDVETYDKLLQKFEKESREHIQIEQKLKLYIDSIEEKIEHLEKIIKELEKNLDVKTFENGILKDTIKDITKKHEDLKIHIENANKEYSRDHIEKLGRTIYLDKFNNKEKDKENPIKNMVEYKSNNDEGFTSFESNYIKRYFRNNVNYLII